MKKISKTLALLLSLVMLVALCVGCADNGGETNPSPTPTETQTEPTPTQDIPDDDVGEEETSRTAEGTKVAYLFASSIGDGGWNYTQYVGLTKIAALGAETSHQESVAYSSAAANLVSYCELGYEVIFLSTSNFLEYVYSMNTDYPDVTFFVISSSENNGNVRGFLIKDQDQGFMQGVIAALLTKTGKVGIVGSSEFTAIRNGLNGFAQGVAYVDESIEVVLSYTGSGTDTALAKETATAMIEDGCDVIAPFCDNASAGVVQACEENDVWCVGNGVDQDTLAPNKMVVSVIKDTSIAVEYAFKLWLNRELQDDVVPSMGADSGVVFLSDYYAGGSALSDEDKAFINETLDKLISGEIVVAAD